MRVWIVRSRQPWQACWLPSTTLFSLLCSFFIFLLRLTFTYTHTILTKLTPTTYTQTLTHTHIPCAKVSTRHMTGLLFGNGNYGAHPLALRANLLCSVHGVYGLPASKLLFILCTYVSSSISLAFISYPVEVRLVNVFEIMGKLKKTSVTKDAATSLGGTICNWARTHFEENIADNADCQLQ